MAKILYIITQAETGGAQRYVLTLAKSAKNKGYETAIAVGNSQDIDLIKKAEKAGIKIFKLKSLIRQINPIKDLLGLFEIRKLYKKFNPDIVHLNSTKAGILGSIANHMPSTICHKLLYTAHGWVFNEPLPKWKKTLYIFLEKWTAKYKDKIICVSNYDRQSAIDNNIATEKKFITVYNGIDAKQLNFLNKSDAKKGLANHTQDTINDTPIIGTVANFYPVKGLRYLIEAINRLENVNLKCIIIGDGKQKSELENLISKFDLQDKVILTGRIKDASKYLKAFDIFVLPSLKEGCPYVLLEAMAAQLPIVASSVGGVNDIIKNKKNGLLVKPANAEALANTIKKLIYDNKLAENMAITAHKDLAINFSESKMIDNTFLCYKQ